MVKYLLFIITMTCCIGCNTFRNEPTVKLQHSIEKDTLLKSFGVSYIDLKRDSIILINKRISCVLQPLVTSNKGETNYFRLKLNKDKNTVYLMDSILSVGKILYNSKTSGFIFPFINIKMQMIFRQQEKFNILIQTGYYQIVQRRISKIQKQLVLTIVDCSVCT